MTFARSALPLIADAMLLGAGVWAQQAPVSRGWIEDAYANGLYAAMNGAFVPLTNALPFALGDAVLVVAVVAFVWWWVATIRGARGRRIVATLRLLAHAAGIAGVVLLIFQAAWALNYRRAPIIERVAFDPARVTDAAVAAFSARIVRDLNATAPLAHGRVVDSALRAHLRDDFLPVVARLGDRFEPVVTVPKVSIVDPYYQAAGIGGQYVPLTFETYLNAQFLPWELPRALAHEWTHVAGFGDEGDANYAGTLACLRSSDPLIRYSGLFWTYADLPEEQRARLPVSALVRADLIASRDRFLRYYRPQLFSLTWRVYDRYLAVNRVAGGVHSYARFVQLLVGVPLDHEGLPILRHPAP